MERSDIELVTGTVRLRSRSVLPEETPEGYKVRRRNGNVYDKGVGPLEKGGGEGRIMCTSR